MQLSGPYLESVARAPSLQPLPSVDARPLARTARRSDPESGSTASADLSPPAAPSRKSEAALAVLGHLADLVENVRSGMEQNRRSADPAQANRRLLDTASQLAQSMLSEARVDGQPLFSKAPGRTPAVYGRQAVPGADTGAQSQAKSLLQEAAGLFRSLQPSSSEEENRANYVLGKFKDRVRGVVRKGAEKVDAKM